MNGLLARARRRLLNECGQAIVLVALALVAMLGMAALAIDVGYTYYVQRSLQASADAAALAGASQLPNGSTATAVARTYSASAGQKNARANIPGVTTSVLAKCVSIAPCVPVNAVEVKESVAVPTRFAKVLGFDTFTVNVKSTACSPCATRPLDVMLVLDRTGSMCMDHYGNMQAGCPDLVNARNGLLTFLGYMDPALDKVGLAVFPPARSVGQRCNTPADWSYGGNPAGMIDADYNNASYPYVVSQLATDYKTGNNLNTSSQLVSTINCIKANGITAYANALEKAQAELDARGRANVQDVIVFFSDGAANYGSTLYSTSSPYRTRPCQQGINSAATIKARGTLIYSIGYDLTAVNEDDDVNTCRAWTFALELPAITATSTLQQIASPNGFYFQPTAGELNSIYTRIAGEISGAKLIDQSVS